MKNEPTWGPGAFLTKEDLAMQMTDEKRPIVGGSRLYGSEYDGFFADRRVPTSGGAAAEPTINGAGGAFFEMKDLQIGQVGQCRYRQEAASTGECPNAAVCRARCPATQAARVAGLGRLLGRLRGMRGMRGLGATTPAEAPFDIIAATKDMYGTVNSIKPFLEFVGNNPILTVSIFMLAIGIGSALGGYIGAGGADILKKKL